MRLDKLIKIKDLREVWKNESADFTPWLSKEENLSLLGETIGIDITLEEKESNVGDFSVDIFAKEEGTGRNIIIENQLEDTNHDHLGKIITYASGKNAQIIIWIVRRARDEHRNAIEWLNNHTDDSLAFFLIEIELWKIGDSQPAAKFNIVEQPNEWLKTMKAQESMKPADKIKIAFWSAFKDYCLSLPSFDFSLRKPSTNHWYNFAIGKGGFYIQLTADTQKKTISAGLLIKDDKDLYNLLKIKSSAIAEILGDKPDFSQATKESRMRIYMKSIDFKDDTLWHKYFEWFVEQLPKLRKIADDFTD